MIDALSETYKELAAETMGVSPNQVSVLMVHRPHEDKNYADQSVYFFFLPRERFPSAVGKVGFDPAGAHYLERERRGLQFLLEFLLIAEFSCDLFNLLRAHLPRHLLKRLLQFFRLSYLGKVTGQRFSSLSQLLNVPRAEFIRAKLSGLLQEIFRQFWQCFDCLVNQEIWRRFERR